MGTAGYLPDLTWEQARDAFAAGAVGLLPIGATEAHGPHLPLQTDVYLSLELCFRLQVALGDSPPAVVLAPLSFAVTEYARGFPGTLSISPQTAGQLLRELLLGLARHGAKRVALINSHLEPAHLAVIQQAGSALEGGPELLFVDHCRKPWALELSEEFKTGDCHAGSYETSLMLASRFADRVRADRLRELAPQWLGLVKKMRAGVPTFEEMGAAGAYFGDPAASSAEEGERMWGVLLRMWIEQIAELPGEPSVR